MGIRLRYQNSKQCYDMQSILATFLHELAHAITPGEMSYGRNEKGKCVIMEICVLFDQTNRS